MALNKELLDILACPKCKQPVELTGDEKWLVCGECKLKYAIKGDIPIMLIEEAEPLEG